MKQPMANQHGGAVGGLAACANHAGTGGGLAAVMRPGGGAQFSVTSELEQFFKEPEGLCALKIRIVDRVFTLDDALDGFSSTVAADFHRMRETLNGRFRRAWARWLDAVVDNVRAQQSMRKALKKPT